MPPRALAHDPYRKFKFKVLIDGTAVAGLTKCSALSISVEAHDFRAGDHDSFKQKLPGQVTYQPVTLEQGVTADTGFEQWATAMSNYIGNQGADSEKLDEFRKDIDIEINNHRNEKVKSYRVFNCWVSKYTAVPDLDANSNDVMIQTLELQNEGIKALA